MSSSRVSLLGVPIDVVTQTEALALLRAFLKEDRQRHVMTPNNEMLVEAAGNASFRSLLHRSDLNIPDSVGLLTMARWTGQRLPERVTGVDTVTRLCETLSEESPIFLLGAEPGVAESAAQKLMDRNPRLRVVGCFAGSPREEEALSIVAMIRASAPRLLLVAFGSPAQDLWIDRHRRDFPSVRVSIGVGGTFDFLAGKVKRAPRFLQSMGLEWLWRLLHDPRRIGRIWRAVVVFPLLVVRYGTSAPTEK